MTLLMFSVGVSVQGFSLTAVGIVYMKVQESEMFRSADVARINFPSLHNCKLPQEGKEIKFSVKEGTPKMKLSRISLYR